jgi:hypothetical protein
MIKALCAVLHRNPGWMDQGAALLDVFDSIDLMAIQKASAVDGAANPTFPTGALILEFCRRKLNLFKGR